MSAISVPGTWTESAYFVHTDATDTAWLICNPCMQSLLFLGKTQLHYVCVAFDTKEETQEENCHPVPKPESRMEVCDLSPCPPR